MQQPSKYITQCGTLTILFGAIIIIGAVNSLALTTFGKSSNPAPTTKPLGKGRECKTHLDCEKFLKTSCVYDPNDFKLRCLCGDDTPPNNGLCPNVLKGLHHICTKNSDCEVGSICLNDTANQTSLNPKHFKICSCDTDNGYTQDNVRDICSEGWTIHTTKIFGVSSYLLIITSNILRYYNY